jgi:pimeloyl-ACP methyl ester carboxylesterase
MALKLFLVAVLTMSGWPAAPPPAVHWSDCDGARCGTISVPKDWSRPHHGTIDLRVAVRPAADPAHRIGTLFLNPGGPGSGAADIAANPDWAAFYLPPQLLQRFDLVGIDPRGVAASAPVICTDPAHDPAVTRFPTTGPQIEKLADRNREFARSCTAMNLDTDSVARDFDAVRAALGERQISFLGVSYGTMLAQAYAERFPDRVRAMVLDGVVDRSRPAAQLMLDDAAAVQDSVQRFATRCAANADCPLHGQDVLHVLRAADAKAAAGQVTVDGRAMTPEELHMSVNDALNSPLLDQSLATGLRSAVSTGDGAPLYSISRYGSPDYAPYRAIICADVPRAPAAALPLLARAATITGPALSGASEFWDIVSGCTGWPHPAQWQPHPWRVPPTVRPLILSGAHDPATPRAWAESVHRQLPGSTLVRWDGDGHAAFPVGNRCAVQAAVEHLIAPDQPPRVTC